MQRQTLLPKKYIPEETAIATQINIQHICEMVLNSSPAGAAILNVRNPKSGSVHQLEFVVVDADLPPILGMEAVIDLDLVKTNYDNFVFASVVQLSTLIDKYISVFDGGLGRLPGTVTLSINKEIRPRILPTRRIPVTRAKSFQKGIRSFVRIRGDSQG